MIISPEFAIAHIPKTGGHALAVMLYNAGVTIKHPFKIKSNKAFSTKRNKHITFSSKDLGERKLFVVIRRLPDWLLSYMWHQSKHTFMNDKNRVSKRKIGQSYHGKVRRSGGFLYLPTYACYSCFPDQILRKYCKGQNVTYLRMEYLIEDVESHLDIKLKDIGKYHSYGKNLPSEYWPPESTKILYECNPFWATIEKRIYPCKEDMSTC